jgi:hypothetical protein
MAQGIAAIRVGRVGIPSVMPGLAMPDVGVPDVGVPDMAIGAVNVLRRLLGGCFKPRRASRRMPGRVIAVSRRVRVGAEGAGENERKRRHGRNQPCRAYLARTTHLGFPMTSVPRLWPGFVETSRHKLAVSCKAASDATLLQFSDAGVVFGVVSCSICRNAGRE